MQVTLERLGNVAVVLIGADNLDAGNSR